MKFIFFIFFIFIITVGIFSLPHTLFAWQYPTKNLKITSLFGESRQDHFHNGMDFAIAQPIYPIEEGELLFYSDKEPMGKFYGVGNHMVLEHPQGIRSYYYHFEDNSIEKNQTFFKKDQVLGNMGDSGKSYGKHLHLTIVDPKKRQLLNPQVILPRLNDTRQPVISSLFFTIPKKKKFLKIKNRMVIYYSKNITLYLIAGDFKSYYPNSKTINGNNALGLRSITFMVDGSFYKRYQFDYLVQEGNQLVLSTGEDFDNAYGLAFNYKLGDFFPSKKNHSFSINIQDWEGNQQSAKYEIFFRF